MGADSLDGREPRAVGGAGAAAHGSRAPGPRHQPPSDLRDPGHPSLWDPGGRDTEAQEAEGREDPGCGAARTRGCPGSVLSGSVALS